MKKQTAIAISSVVIAGFVAILVYGLRHARGIPGPTEPPKRAVLDVALTDIDIAVETAAALPLWKDIPAIRLDTIYQVTMLPWPKTRVPEIDVRAVRTAEDIVFYMTWPDATEDRTPSPGRFSDGCALMFPLGEDVSPSSLLMGFLGKSNIWHWKADRDAEFWQGKRASVSYADFVYPFEDSEVFPVARDKVESAVSDLLAVRVGTVTPKESQPVQGRGLWTNGAWHVVFKRPIAPQDNAVDAAFLARTNTACAFAVWNGTPGDRGGRKTITDFVTLNLTGEEAASAEALAGVAQR